MTTRRVLVTGATGFVGANLTRRLLRDGHEVHLLLRAQHAPWRIDEIRDDVRVHVAELDDSSDVALAFRDARPEWVFHLAVYGAYSSQTDWRRMLATNVLGTGTLIEAATAAHVEVVVNTGSSSEYGFVDHAPSEHEAVDPNSYYAVSKASATMFARYAAIRSGVRIPTLRLYSAYGPYEEPGRFVPTLLVRGREESFPPLARPETARDFVYVDDVSDAYVRAASMASADRGAVFNVGSGRQTTLREMVDAVRRLYAVSAEPVWGSYPPRAWDSEVWVADAKRIRQELGWTAVTSLDAGLAATAAWLDAHPELASRYGSRAR